MTANLTPDEIALLLQTVQGSVRSGEQLQCSDSGAQRFDLLASQERILRGKFPGLESVFDRYCRSVRTSLTRSLTRNCHSAFSGIETMKFGQFVKRLPLPSSLHLFRLTPLPGHAILVLSQSLASTHIDVSFGGTGSGKPKAEGREFSAIETRLLAKLAATLLDDFGSAFSAIAPVQPVYVGSESNPLAVSVASASDNVVVANLELTIESGSGVLTFCLPWSTLQPVRDKLASGMQMQSGERSAHSAAAIESHLRSAHCRVSVSLASGEIKVHELLALKIGDTLALTAAADSAATVRVEGTPKFTACVGISRGNKAAKILAPIR